MSYISATVGVWKVSNGKGNRHHITHEGGDEEINIEKSGILTYGFEHIQDLAIAILEFERKKKEADSILEKFDKLKETIL